LASRRPKKNGAVSGEMGDFASTRPTLGRRFSLGFLGLYRLFWIFKLFWGFSSFSGFLG
jgi:hypothetical protein